MNAIEVHGLRKEYSHRGKPSVAVAGLDLAVPEGGVFGFLGPNGSGKTTTIRCLLGLAAATGGQMSILGRPVPSDLRPVLRRVGAIVEMPLMFPTMSARENLAVLGRIDGIGTRRVDECLGLVGLADRAGDHVRKYSLGMRQRLGLAAALLKDPELLVLDEPANGLDPAGIREIRELLRGLGREGRTVFVSSHQLAEVEQTCDRVAIIDHGQLRLSGDVDHVLAAAAGQSVLVGLTEVDSGLDLLRRAGLRAEPAGALLRVALPPEGPAAINKLLADAGLYAHELRAESVTLEQLFLDVTEGAR